MFKLSRSSTRILLLLVCGLLICFGLMHWLLGVYRHNAPRKMPVGRVVRRINHAVILARALPFKKRHQALEHPYTNWMHLKLSSKPYREERRVYAFTPKAFKHLIMIGRHKRFQRFSILIKDNLWLNVLLFHMRKNLTLQISLLLALVLLFISMITMCLLAISRIALPYENFANAVKQAASEPGANKLVLSGPPLLQEAKTAMNEMQLRFANLLKDRTQLLAAISHDLRTPITRLKLRAESFEEQPYYDKVVDDLNEMEQMIQSVLAFAQDNSREESTTRLDLVALLESQVNDNQDAGFSVSFNSDVDKLAIQGRLLSLKRAFSNVINNGIKYGHEVSVSCTVEEDHVNVTFDDKGPGIPEHELERVFEPFYRVEPSRSRQTGGTGLGLVVAREVIRQHEGEITLTNLPEGGLRVLVCLPLA